MFKPLRFALALALIGWAPAANAQIIAGPAEANDGDSLTLTGVRIRLHGIDAVELNQTCERDGAAWACGQEAKATLVQLIEGRTVECSVRDTDLYGRFVAQCRAGSVDLAEAVVLAGFAVALPEFSAEYVESEERARGFRLGIWNSSFQPPAEWRAAHPGSEPVTTHEERRTFPVAPRVYRDARGHCAIKGNHSRRGDWIYHLPGQPYYEQTRPEALFCTEEDAQRAGYRASRAR